MTRISLILLLFLVSFRATTQEAKDYSEALTLINAWLDAQKDYEQLPGLTALVVDDQKVLWNGAYGWANKEGQVKASPSTIFSICSISKLFTAIGVMKLYDDGKLRLDDEVDDILPWYNLKQRFPESGPITIRSLLTHSSGLPRESDHPYWSRPDFNFPTKEQIKKGLSNQETLYPTSTYFQYSNLGLTLLGEIIEQVSGEPYEEYVRKNILKPLNMNDTYTFLPEDRHGKELAIGYGAPVRSGDRERLPIFQAKGINAAAGFSSNVTDLGKLASWQFRLLDTTQTEILKPSTLKEMHRVHWTDPDWNTTWGLGFSVRRDGAQNTVVGHGGSCPGYRSEVRLDPKNKKAFVVMINAGGANPAKYINGISQLLQKYKVEKTDKTSKSNKLNLQDYSGYYNQQPWWSEAYITAWQGKLVMLSLPSDEPDKALTFFKHVEKDTFYRIREDDKAGETLTFERDKNGKVVRFKRHGNYSEKLR
jgi:CubicO group peptidase (beta-lactamase class C family)